MNGLLNGDLRSNLQTIAALMQIIFLPALAYLLLNSIEHEKRIVAIESTRFTISDGAALLQAIKNIEKEQNKLTPDEARTRIRAIEQHLARTDQYKP